MLGIGCFAKLGVNRSSLGLNIVGSGGGRCWFAAIHV